MGVGVFARYFIDSALSNPPTILWKCCFYAHFVDDETESVRVRKDSRLHTF